MSAPSSVRCRFAPSPTGYLHLGGARTALFNYLFAKSLGGAHVLRIEDTDRERSTPEATQAILDGLAWLNIGYDEGPFFQSERNDLYLSYAAKLLASGDAYPCTCSSERLDAVRAEQSAAGKKPQYDRACRPAKKNTLPPQLPTGRDATPFVIRLRAPEVGTISFDDQILGTIETANEEIDDFIIVRSDGTPTYNFTVVVDDIEMGITNVIRGMDHVSNTPKQILIYQALGAKPPMFAHVPMILGPDKKKLSKRHGATSVVEYKRDGYLPDAFVNYLARLGWSHGDQEIFSREELIKYFSLEHVGKSPAVFDQEKLLWVNAEHMRKLSAKELAPFVIDVLQDQQFDVSELRDSAPFEKLIANLQERSRSLVEMANGCHFFLVAEEKLVIDDSAAKKHLTPAIREPLRRLASELADCAEFTEQPLETIFHRVIGEFNIGLGKLAQPVRVAVTGSSVSPPIYPVLEILGKSRSLWRLARALETIPQD